MTAMPTIMTHAAVGLGFAAVVPLRPRPRFFWTLSAVLPAIPDLDVIWVALGVPFGSLWGHRGITHSLPFAVLLGTGVAAALTRGSPARWWPLAAYASLLTASHGLLDACTNGGPGIAFLAPFSETRYFFPWRPVLVSPLPAHFFSAWGAQTLWSELRWIWAPTALVVGAVRLGGRRRR
jgi:inner membrane protein